MASLDPIPLFDLVLREDELQAVEAILRSGELRSGAATERFEAAFADHLGCAHAVAVASCTAALQLAYLAVGVGAGDEVIVPSYTFVATAAAVLHCGGRPVFADVRGPHEPTIDTAHVESLLTPRTKAVVCVHFGGYAAPVHELRALCDRHGLALIEDAAHAPSARAGGSMLGTIGDAGCFSFFSNKVLSVGEGGLLSTNDPRIAEAARASARDSRYRFDDQRAALAQARLAHLDEDLAARRRLTQRYRELLSQEAGIVLPFEARPVGESSCYIMPVMLSDPERRDAVRLALRERHGIQTSVLYPSVHEFSDYRRRYGAISLPQTERCARSEITLPLYPHLTDAGQDRVVAALLEEIRR